MIEIIPAIDIINGECVRLTQGDYSIKTVYSTEPLEIARRFEAIGIKRLHMVDLDGAKNSSPVNLYVLEQIASKTNLKIEYGGGIKSEEALRRVLDSGAERAICGSIAVTNPEHFSAWLKRYGGDAVVLGADVRDGFVAVNGWLESSKVTVEEVIENFANDGLRYVICTDISRDGMLKGPSFELYETLQAKHPSIDIIVSGGVSSAKDIQKLNEMNLRSVIVGKAYYEGKITETEIRNLISNKQ